MNNLDLKLTKKEVDLLDAVLTKELIKFEFPNGKQKTFSTEEEKQEYKVLADLLRKIEDATTFFH